MNHSLRFAPMISRVQTGHRHYASTSSHGRTTVYRIEPPQPLANYAQDYGSSGWDGADAEPITLDAVHVAREVLNYLSPWLRKGLGEPQAAPGIDGTIGFEWHLTSGHVENLYLEVSASGSVKAIAAMRGEGAPLRKVVGPSLASAEIKLKELLEDIAYEGA